MWRTMMKGKIHRARVTGANIEYEGSITIDRSLLEASDILPNEQVHVVDVTNGVRLETYAIAGEAGSGTVCINGAAARLIHEGDLVIIISYCQVPDEEASALAPRVIKVDSANAVVG